MTTLISSDLHLTSSPRDLDRWRFLPWLREQARRYKVDQVLLLGDNTDAKDNHPASLVERLAGQINDLSEETDVIILKGNHDYIDPRVPFFGFLRHLRNVVFVNEPMKLTLPITDKETSCLFLPSTRDWATDWKDWIPKFDEYNYIFTHMTFDGAKAENGQALHGLGPVLFNKIPTKVYSGDIHVPQKIGKNIEYVGSPYWVHFGDSFTPRVLLLDKEGQHNLQFPAQKRHVLLIGTVEALQRQSFAKGDQVKIRFELARSDYSTWPEIRAQLIQICKDKGWQLHGTEPIVSEVTQKVEVTKKTATSSVESFLEQYGKKNRLQAQIIQRGKFLLEGARKEK